MCTYALCVYVCVHACMHMHVHVHAPTRAHKHACLYDVHKYICKYVAMYVRMWLCNVGNSLGFNVLKPQSVASSHSMMCDNDYIIITIAQQ